MIRASITPGIARTLFSRSSESMIAPLFSNRRSKRRSASVRAGLGVTHFPGGPPRSTGPGQDPDLIVDNLDSEHLVTSGHDLPRREGKYLAAGSPDLDLLTVLIPKCRHHSFHRDCLLSRQKTTFLAAGELQIHPARAILDPRRDNLYGYVAPALPGLSKAFQPVGKTGIADEMEMRFGGWEQYPPYSSPRVPSPLPGTRTGKSEYGAGEMRPGFTLLQFVLPPLLN